MRRYLKTIVARHAWTEVILVFFAKETWLPYTGWPVRARRDSYHSIPRF